MEHHTPANNPPKEFSVSELSKAIQATITQTFRSVRLRGEISGLKRHTSGHIYLSLKDADAVIDAICWRGTSAKLPRQPEEGLEVICTGRITTYPARSKYQFIIETLEPAGVGALLKLLQERKEKLQAEGLFDATRKKPLPLLPKRIGVITSATGAVLHDILHRIKERFPLHIQLWPVAVQGDSSPQEIVRAIEGFQKLPSSISTPDLLILARGGGSLEDLWGFNDEQLVRAIAACSIPLISAVGHETDFTLADYAADKRAPTPTAAAEMAVPVRSDMLYTLETMGQRLLQATQRQMDTRLLKFDSLARSIESPQRRIEEYMQTLDDRGERLNTALRQCCRQQQMRLQGAVVRLPTSDKFFAFRLQKIEYFSERLQAIRLQNRILEGFEKMNNTWSRAPNAIANVFSRLESKHQQQGALLESLSHQGILKRGFVLVSKAENNQLIKSAHSLQLGEQVKLTYADGTRHAKVMA